MVKIIIIGVLIFLILALLDVLQGIETGKASSFVGGIAATIIALIFIGLLADLKEE